MDRSVEICFEPSLICRKTTIETAKKIGPLSYTVLIDEKHLVSKLYNMVNVPTGVWINEQGRIVRPNEVAFVDDRFKNFTGMDSEPYLNALKDWVEKGDKSAYVMSEDHLREKLTAQDPNIAQAAAEFGLGEQLYKSGHPDRSDCALQGSAAAESEELELQAPGLCPDQRERLRDNIPR